MLLTALGIAIAAILGFWIAGGVVLRLGGILLALLGVLVLTAGQSIAGLLVFAVGALLWLTGHWHYALRHHSYKSPLARRIFLQLLPARLDPTRGWAMPIGQAPQRRGNDRPRLEARRQARWIRAEALARAPPLASIGLAGDRLIRPTGDDDRQRHRPITTTKTRRSVPWQRRPFVRGPVRY